MGFASLAALVLFTAAQEEPAPAPKGRDLDALVAEFVSLDPMDAEQRARGDAILAEVERVPPLTAKDSARWRKKLDKLVAKKPALESKSGRHFLWPAEDGAEDRGLYVVGGETRRPKALFIGLHGGGAGAGEASSAHAQFDAALQELDWVGVFPEVLEKTEHGWTDSGTEEFVVELIERAQRTWKIDPDRVYLGGHSMGGYGTWTIGAHHADRFAALLPSAGAPTPVLSPRGVVDVVPGVIQNLRNVRMVIYQSDDDPRVPPDVNRKAVELLGEARAVHGGYAVEYWEVPGRGHDGPPGGMAALLAKVADVARRPLPDKVIFQPTLDWQRRRHWLRWDRPVPEAILIAEATAGAREIRVRGWVEPRGIRVLVNDEFGGFDEPLRVLYNDVPVFEGVPERSLAALLATGARGDARLTFDGWIPLDAAGDDGGSKDREGESEPGKR